MSFVHDDRDFPQLLTLVTEETRIAPALVEKDYWVTHCMWALHQTGLDLWFKGLHRAVGGGMEEQFGRVTGGSVIKRPRALPQSSSCRCRVDPRGGASASARTHARGYGRVHAAR